MSPSLIIEAAEMRYACCLPLPCEAAKGRHTAVANAAAATTAANAAAAATTANTAAANAAAVKAAAKAALHPRLSPGGPQCLVSVLLHALLPPPHTQT